MDGPQGATNEAGLSEALRERTAALHRKAERSGIIADILHGRTDRRGYALLLRNLLPAYREMEAALDCHADRPVLRAFAQRALYRSESLGADLAALCGPSWGRDLPLLAAGERYASRIAASAADGGVRLAAHAYVRYFGDLSGGQILKRLLGQALELPAAALSFYEFPDIGDAADFKAQMRALMDDAIMRAADRAAILDEGVRAFEHNIEVSEAVQALLVQPA